MPARQPYTSSGYGSPGLSLRAYMGQRGSSGPLWMASWALLDTLTTKPGRLWPSQAGRAGPAQAGLPNTKTIEKPLVFEVSRLENVEKPKVFIAFFYWPGPYRHRPELDPHPQGKAY